MRVFSFAVVAAVLAVSGHAFAETCPAVGDIAQKAEGSGYLYAAKGNWRGENPMAGKEDLQIVKFVNAKITDNSVICRYAQEGTGAKGASLSLSRPSTATPAGSAWKDGVCEGDIGGCTFN